MFLQLEKKMAIKKLEFQNKMVLEAEDDHGSN